jgi:hypothetical protein
VIGLDVLSDNRFSIPRYLTEIVYFLILIQLFALIHCIQLLINIRLRQYIVSDYVNIVGLSDCGRLIIVFDCGNIDSIAYWEGKRNQS